MRSPAKLGRHGAGAQGAPIHAQASANTNTNANVNANTNASNSAKALESARKEIERERIQFNNTNSQLSLHSQRSANFAHSFIWSRHTQICPTIILQSQDSSVQTNRRIYLLFVNKKLLKSNQQLDQTSC